MKKYVFTSVLLLLISFVSVLDGLANQQKIIIKSKDGKSVGYLGVMLQDVTKKIVKRENLPVTQGAYIDEVVENSPAEDAGIKEGDVIIKFGDKAVDDSDELRAAIQKTEPKTEVKVEFYRKSEKKVLTVKVGKSKSMAPNSYYFNDESENRSFSIPKMPNLSELRNLHVSVFTSDNELSGMKIQDITRQLGAYFGTPNRKGVLITEVKKESGAAKAGFKAGDVIIKANDDFVDNIEELNETLEDGSGQEIVLQVIRNGKTLSLKMKYERDDNDEDEHSLE
jgi:serine protease Do